MDIDDIKRMPTDEFYDEVKALSYREREALKLFTGKGDGYEYTIDEIGYIFRMGAKQSEQLIAKALAKFRKLLNQRKHGVIEREASVRDALCIAVQLPEFVDEDFVTEKLVELYRALNGMHIGAGGSGLRLDQGDSFADACSREGAPTR